MLRRLLEALYVDMRCFGVSWFLHNHEFPHPNQWGSLKNHQRDADGTKSNRNLAYRFLIAFRRNTL